MNIVVLPQAADEFQTAVMYYSDKHPGLGQRFRDEVNRHIQWVTANADVPRLRSGGYRRVNLKVFPYYLAYLEMAGTLWILAIAHSHREPEYWIDRKDSIS